MPSPLPAVTVRGAPNAAPVSTALQPQVKENFLSFFFLIHRLLFLSRIQTQIVVYLPFHICPFISKVGG